MPLISSPDNKYIKLASSLKNRKYRDAAGMFLVEGWRSVGEVLIHPGLIEAILVSGDERHRLDGSGLPDERIMPVQPKLLKHVCAAENPQGVAALVRKPRWAWEQFTTRGGLLVYLDRVSDPGNIGSILRSGLALGVRGVLMSPGCVDLFNPKVVRSTMGAILNLPVLPAAGCAEINALRKAGYSITCTGSGEGRPYYDVDLTVDTVVILGSEGHGVSGELKALCGSSINIPVESGVESLNVAAACAIIIAEARRQRRGSTG